MEEGDKRRAVCYDLSKRKVLKSYEEAREPVKLSNVSGKRCGGRMAYSANETKSDRTRQ